MDSKTCETCMYWVRHEASDFGYCHERPPLPDKDSGRVFPLTATSDWCSYHDPVEDKAPDSDTELLEAESEGAYWKRRYKEMVDGQVRTAILTGL